MIWLVNFVYCESGRGLFENELERLQGELESTVMNLRTYSLILPRIAISADQVKAGNVMLG